MSNNLFNQPKLEVLGVNLEKFPALSRWARKNPEGLKPTSTRFDHWVFRATSNAGPVLPVTAYSAHATRGAAADFLAQVKAAAAQLKFLQGEAFSLSGEFLQRGFQVFRQTKRDGGAFPHVANCSCVSSMRQ